MLVRSALVSIDINSGKYTKQRNIEDTAFKTNLEAAEEISRQLKIRDLAGLIVIDFIDMLDRGHNFKVEKKLKECVKEDRARVQIGRISNFGLLELSRQRLKVTTDTVMSSTCHICNGYGSITSTNFLFEQLIKVCNEFAYNPIYKNLFLLVGKNLSNVFFDKMNISSTPFSKKVSVVYYPNLNENEFLICSATEVLFKNCHEKNNIDNFLDYLKVSKTKFEKKEDNNLDKENILTKKRVSYRAKANDLDNEKLIKIKANEKIKSKKLDKINIPPKNESKKEEKRQGWWNQ